MAGVAYYNTGTATVAVNSKTVTGTGTNWLSVVGGLTAIKAGDKFGIHVGRPIIIASVDSNTQLTLEDDWPGPAQTDAAYRIELTSPDVIAVEAMRRMLGSLSSGVLYGLSQLPSTPSKALTIDENGSAALADLSTLGKSLIAALNSSAAYGTLGTVPDAQLPTRLTGTELDARYNKKSDVIPDTQLPSTMTGKTFNGNVVVKSAFYVDNQTYRTIYFRNTAGVVQASIISNGDDGSIILRLNNDAGVFVRDFKIPRTGNVTIGNNAIWTDGNDGAGSGLDADLLDGQQGAYYRDLANAVGMLSPTKVTGIREVLTGSRTYYVRVGGSNSNTGLVNTDAGAFATLQYAYDFIATKLDLKGFDVTISLADGYHTTGLNASIGLTGGNVIYIRGNVTTPGNCFLEVTNSHCILNTVRNLKINVGGLRLSTLTAGTCLWASGGNIELGASCLFAPAANGDHFLATDGGNIVITADYSVAGGCVNHWHAYGQGQITCQNRTITISAAVSMTRWAGIATALLTSTGCTFTGKANVSGATYLVHRNGVVIVEGAGTSYFPGNSAGTVQTGGQYV
ncbi:hypothetical protein J5288_09230 [Agrobacterium sp. S2/73]|uniref:hypothetical protein n=1 Tax=unclassified Agrobacterium TaxID=2632611 RepID=UPI001ADA6D55|nr:MULTISPECIES: hypothetical protein [unclassified Agrobacterium]MBO9108886.1 hypothetical protein [Agrobacterium sp. S2/73]QXZ73363.1 hypothetical protein J5276_05280 [Agrobacterium sp. S7/73]